MTSHIPFIILCIYFSQVSIILLKFSFDFIVYRNLVLLNTAKHQIIFSLESMLNSLFNFNAQVNHSSVLSNIFYFISSHVQV